MRTLTTAAAAMTLAIGSSGAAIAQQGGHAAMQASAMDQVETQAMMADMAPRPDDAASTKDFKQADMRMMRNMHAPFTGDPDVDFRTHMIPHHQGAVDMAKVALKHARDPATKRMAQTIIKDQEKEIGQMQAWLKQHGR